MSVTRQNHIEVLSIDFDGCLFNTAYRESQDENRLISCNQSFFDFITNTIAIYKPAKIICLVGSNRQSYKLDQVNAKKTSNHPSQRTLGSCFPAIAEVTRHIQSRSDVPCILDPYLLADSFGNRRHGENYHHAVSLHHVYEFADAPFDDSKIILLYAQTHKLASEHRGAKIIFNFFDDRDDILAGLYHFYSSHPEFLPENIELCLYEYSGQKVKAFCHPLTGIGPINETFEHQMKVMKGCIKVEKHGKNALAGLDESNLNSLFELSHETQPHQFLKNKIHQMVQDISPNPNHHLRALDIINQIQALYQNHDATQLACTQSHDYPFHSKIEAKLAQMLAALRAQRQAQFSKLSSHHVNHIKNHFCHAVKQMTEDQNKTATMQQKVLALTISALMYFLIKNMHENSKTPMPSFILAYAVFILTLVMSGRLIIENKKVSLSNVSMFGLNKHPVEKLTAELVEHINQPENSNLCP